MKRFWVVLVAGVALALGGCGYNDIQRSDEGVTAAWSEVTNQYQRRADLIPNLVETVKGFAQQEKDVLTQVTEARSRAGSIKLTPEMLNDPAALQKFQQAQGELSGALSRLLVTVEKYPELKSDKNFLELQAQLEGTENRIAQERQRFNTTVQTYNTAIRVFPASLVASFRGFGTKEFFQADAGAEKVPQVKF